MVGHLEVPALDPCKSRPSSLSKRVIDSLLVNRLNFKGLVFTDALAMRGVSGHSRLCLQALQAGNDLLLAPRRIKDEIDAVVSAVENGELPEDEINRKCRKVLTYKYALGLTRAPYVNPVGLKSRIDTPYTRGLIERLKQASVSAGKQ